MLRYPAIAAVVLVAIGLLAPSAWSGGWATVTLDRPIREPRAGELLTVSFVVKQHGVEPVHEAFGQPVEPVLVARGAKPGETLKLPATRGAALGAFAVEVTFPTAGTLFVEIIPAPFAGTPIGEVTVLTPDGRRLERPVSAASAAEEATLGRAAPAPARARADPSSRRDTAIALGLVTLIALVLADRGRRARAR
jgi:hypothetical protein